MLGVNQIVNEQEMTKLVKGNTVQLTFPDQALRQEMHYFGGQAGVKYPKHHDSLSQAT